MRKKIYIMTGEIVKAITLTTYGTAFLKDNYDIRLLTLDHPSFSFTNKVEFLYFKKHFFSRTTWHKYADNPIEWLTKLKQDGCKEIRLVFQADNSVSLGGQIVPDHKLAGFVGGGGQRYVQTIFDNYSDFWQSREEVTDKDSPNQKIWTVSYGRTLVEQSVQAKRKYDNDNIKERLKSKLFDISSFAKESNLPFWAEWFDTALNILNSPTSLVNERVKQFIPTDKMSLSTIQLLAGSEKAWCFGGMGSWNDISFNEKDKQEKYDRLTSELYDIVTESYLAIANSYE